MAPAAGGGAWRHVTYLVEELGARGSGTSEEGQAADYVAGQLRDLGIAYEEQPFRSAASAWRPFATTFALAALAAFIAPWYLPASAIAAVFLLLLTILLSVREALLKDTPLRRLLPQVDSRNIIGRLPPAGEVMQKIVLVAHLDSHRTPYFHRSRRRQRWFGFMILLGEFGAFFNSVLFLALALSQELWLWWLAVPFALLDLAMALACAAVDRTPFSPGANDNAAAVGAALAAAYELRQQPLAHTDLWLLFSGCEEVGAYGMREFLKLYGAAIPGARFIDLEMVGQGVPGVVVKEGLIRRVNYDAQLIAAASETAAEVWQPAFHKKANAYGESVVTQRAGFRSVTLNTVLPETGKTAVWHRLDDDMSAITEETIDQVVAWVLALLRRLDGDRARDNPLTAQRLPHAADESN